MVSLLITVVRLVCFGVVLDACLTCLLLLGLSDEVWRLVFSSPGLQASSLPVRSFWSIMRKPLKNMPSSMKTSSMGRERYGLYDFFNALPVAY